MRSDQCKMQNADASGIEHREVRHRQFSRCRPRATGSASPRDSGEAEVGAVGLYIAAIILRSDRRRPPLLVREVVNGADGDPFPSFNVPIGQSSSSDWSARPCCPDRAFHQLHNPAASCIPNPWDAGSARALAALGFKALATTSAGAAWAAGEPDHGVALPPLMAHLREIAGSVDLPVSADFENGLADDPAGVAANVTAAIGTGIAGVSIEDAPGGPGASLYRRGSRRRTHPRGAARRSMPAAPASC